MDVWKRSAEIATIVSGVSGLYVLLKPQVAGTLSRVPLTAPDNLPVVILGASIICASVLNFIALRRKPVYWLSTVTFIDVRKKKISAIRKSYLARKRSFQMAAPSFRARQKMFEQFIRPTRSTRQSVCFVESG